MMPEVDALSFALGLIAGMFGLFMVLIVIAAIAWEIAKRSEPPRKLILPPPPPLPVDPHIVALRADIYLEA